MGWRRLTAGTVLAMLALGCGKPPSPPAPPTSEIQTTAAATAAAEPLAPPSWGDDDWPGWRGPQTDGDAGTQPVPSTWSDRDNVAWKVAIPGRGHSSPIVIGDRIFLETADDAGQVQSVLAIDRRRGRLLWQTDLFTGNFVGGIHQENSHASSTLACDGERLFAVFLNNQRIWCSALDFDGQELWRTEVGGFRSRNGYSASPTVYQSFVIIAADHDDGGFLAALQRDSGQIVWRKKRPAHASYASPRVVTLQGRDRVVLAGCGSVAAYDPLSGVEIWKTRGTAEAAVGTVVTAGDLVFASGGYPEKDTVALQADGKVAWRTRDKVYVPSMIVVDGFLYAVQDDGIAHCWEAASGKARWKQRVGGAFRASPICADGKLYVTSTSGKTTVFRANPERWEVVAENQLGNEALASPAVSRGQLFFRIADVSRGGRQEMLYCIAERSAATKPPKPR